MPRGPSGRCGRILIPGLGASRRCCRFGIPKGLRPKAQWLRGTSYLGKTSPNKSLSLKGGGTFLSPIPPCRSGARMPPLLCSSMGGRDREWEQNSFLSPAFARCTPRDATAYGVDDPKKCLPRVVAHTRSNPGLWDGIPSGFMRMRMAECKRSAGIRRCPRHSPNRRWGGKTCD